MKRIFTLLSIFLILGSLAYGATETVNVKLSTSVEESPLNTGIRVRNGDLTSLFTEASNYAATFATEFASSISVNSLSLNSGVDSATDDAEGYFTILVQRTQSTPVEVTVSATPLQKTDGSNNYIGYKITGQWTPTLLISTLGNPSGQVSGITYQADRRPNAGAFVRDYRVFKYEIPKDNLAAVGSYGASIFFSITVE